MKGVEMKLNKFLLKLHGFTKVGGEWKNDKLSLVNNNNSYTVFFSGLEICDIVLEKELIEIKKNYN